MKQLQCVVIGCGAIGPIHMEAIVACDAANLYGVCDILPERAQRYSNSIGVKHFLLSKRSCPIRRWTVYIFVPPIISMFPWRWPCQSGKTHCFGKADRHEYKRCRYRSPGAGKHPLLRHLSEPV